MKTHFEVARKAYQKLFPFSPFFDTWIPREKFLSAEIDEHGNLTISREDDGIYGIACGVAPVIPSEWKSFSIETRGTSAIPPEYEVAAEWDCYWAPTNKGEMPEILHASDEEIDLFLKRHAPDSSVFPGNDEILQWVEIHSENELVAVAALCRWESGRVVISSVATHSEYRGRGFGRSLIDN